MKRRLAALLLGAVWLGLAPSQRSFADTAVPPTTHAGDDDRANQDLAQELEDFNHQAEQVLKRADQAAPVAVPFSMDKLGNLQAKVLTLAHDDRFLKSAEALWQNENRGKLLGIQAGWFLFMLLFKAWRQSRARHWFSRMLVGLACSLITWAGLSYVIPLAVLGAPFAVFTSTLWRVFVGA